jgi:hypothetical protein
LSRLRVGLAELLRVELQLQRSRLVEALIDFIQLAFDRRGFLDSPLLRAADDVFAKGQQRRDVGAARQRSGTLQDVCLVR